MLKSARRNPPSVSKPAPYQSVTPDGRCTARSRAGAVGHLLADHATAAHLHRDAEAVARRECCGLDRLCVACGRERDRCSLQRTPVSDTRPASTSRDATRSCSSRVDASLASPSVLGQARAVERGRLGLLDTEASGHGQRRVVCSSPACSRSPGDRGPRRSPRYSGSSTRAATHCDSSSRGARARRAPTPVKSHSRRCTQPKPQPDQDPDAQGEKRQQAVEGELVQDQLRRSALTPYGSRPGRSAPIRARWPGRAARPSTMRRERARRARGRRRRSHPTRTGPSSTCSRTPASQRVARRRSRTTMPWNSEFE